MLKLELIFILLFNLDQIFDENKSTEDVFRNFVLPRLKHLDSVPNLTLVAYGYSGTGKSYNISKLEQAILSYLSESFDDGAFMKK